MQVKTHRFRQRVLNHKNMEITSAKHGECYQQNITRFNPKLGGCRDGYDGGLHNGATPKAAWFSSGNPIVRNG